MNTKLNHENHVQLLIDESNGIYIPRKFYENFDLNKWGIDINQFTELKDVENEHYWDAWDELIQHAKYVDSNGITWRLYQDGDLFAITEKFIQADSSWFE